MRVRVVVFVPDFERVADFEREADFDVVLSVVCGATSLWIVVVAEECEVVDDRGPDVLVVSVAVPLLVTVLIVSLVVIVAV